MVISNKFLVKEIEQLNQKGSFKILNLILHFIQKKGGKDTLAG
jgi:hypothetical protein